MCKQSHHASFLRFWEVDFPMEGETCIGRQSDNSCTSVYVPGCEDRNVYCSPLQAPGNNQQQQYPVIIYPSHFFPFSLRFAPQISQQGLFATIFSLLPYAAAPGFEPTSCQSVALLQTLTFERCSSD